MLYDENSTSWYYDCFAFFSQANEVDTCFDRLPMYYPDTEMHTVVKNKEVNTCTLPITCESNQPSQSHKSHCFLYYFWFPLNVHTQNCLQSNTKKCLQLTRTILNMAQTHSYHIFLEYNQLLN